MGSAAAAMALAQEETSSTAIAPEETITVQDLGVSEPKVLPTSPFYFFKEMGRSLQGFVTLNPVAKAELELKFANEKAAEIKKITETQPQNIQAVQKALENYQGTQKKLRIRFEKLSETSQNPNVDKLLDKLTDKAVKHEKLFDEIAFKFKEEGVSRAVSNAKIGSENLMGEASKKDDAAKFSSRLERVLLEEKGGDLKHARSVEIIDRFGGKATTEVKESLERLREEFSERLESDIESLIEKEGENALNKEIANTPGSSGKRAVIIEEIQKRAEERLSEALGKAMKHLETVIQKETDVAQKAKEQIERAEKMIQEVEEKMSKPTETSNIQIAEVVSNLLITAKEHLRDAKSAFEEEKYGEAFGQARSAEVLARNALKAFERERKPKTENFEQPLKELAEKIHTYQNLLKERGFTREQNKEAYELLDNAILHLGYAKEAFAQGNLENAKLHMGHAKEFLSKLSRLIEVRQIRTDEKPTILPATPVKTPAAQTACALDEECEKASVKPLERLKNILK